MQEQEIIHAQYQEGVHDKQDRIADKDIIMVVAVSNDKDDQWSPIYCTAMHSLCQSCDDHDGPQWHPEDHNISKAKPSVSLSTLAKKATYHV